MTMYPTKSVADTDKVRGGYYTPEPIAEFLAAWVSGAGSKLLEPSCGDGRILRKLSTISDQASGVELVKEEATKARKYAPVVNKSLFDWLTRRQRERWDGVAGNPPYIRFGNWPPDQREPALELMREEGLKPTKLTNAWVPCVVASTVAARDGGRVGLVLPAELLQVSYAAQLRDYLISHYRRITLITFERLIFDGVTQEVVLFLGVKGNGPAEIRTVHLKDAQSLGTAKLDGPAAPTLVHDHEKWTKYFLRPRQIQLLRRLKKSPELTTVGRLATVEVGIVTGRNSFFTFTDADVDALNLKKHCVPLVSRSAQLSGLVYDMTCRDNDLGSNHRTWILNASVDSTDPALMKHIRSGEAAEVHLGYKCSLRTPWWRTPSMWCPEIFMLRQIYAAPRMTVNSVNATSTDTVHRVRLNAGVDPVALSTAFHNSATFAFSEILGRSYGGGLLELEPREAELLPVPPPELVTHDLAVDVDLLLKAGEVMKAVDLVDRHVLVEGLGWSPKRVADCQAAWTSLRDRRLSRGKNSSP
ncbi:Eco57I restriction-modification methylase domain-containing protein [Mycobacterium avium]|uniref:Eco57I restriction-modification methylase domain-containing protein n=4 Tax=Mycobacterium avium TaxID=1764 RepID=UPI0009B794B9|nr:class I SAM-dependent methyltransferase [Mycobacterium avium]MCA4761616.1 class I SAM-dependent methyltransferase [Mycobacterium avium subsp. hominissuis]MDV3271189.1 class I SAM-dependent methyltransferase [Mycobacterium avium]